MTIESIVAADIDHLNAMKPDDWDDLTPSIAFYTRASYSTPLKFIENGKIVGMGATIVHGRTAWLGHIIVHPEHRNKGLGTHITKTLIDSLNKKDVTSILLIATSLGGHVYRKLGFETAGDYVFYKDGTAPSVPDLPAVIPFEEKYSAGLLELDREAAGEDRHTMIREHLENAQLFVENDEVKGFYLPALGEGLVVAAHEEAGFALMKQRLGKTPKIALMEGNRKGIGFLEQHGFTEFKRGARMWLGKEIPFRQEMLYGRISGNLG